jgi:uncharacterized membrane protein YGL010W
MPPRPWGRRLPASDWSLAVNTTAADLPQPRERRRIDVLVGQYAESHRHPTNVAVHWVCVPIIVWCTLALMFVVHPWLCYAFVAASLVYYLRLSVPMAVVMAGFTAASVASFFVLPQVGWVALAAFVITWIAQFIGHKIEGKKPSFLTDVVYLMIGPAWILSKIYRKLGWKY